MDETVTSYDDAWACAAEGCGRREDGHADDDWPPNPPAGWLHVQVDRHDAESLTLGFCREEHLRQHLSRALPAPEPRYPEAAEPMPWRERLGCAAGIALALLLVTFLVVGAITTARAVLG